MKKLFSLADPLEPLWSSWFETGSCSVTCGQGSQTRMRLCFKGNCTGNAKEVRPCSQDPCPVKQGTWSPWVETACSATCGHGLKLRKRMCTTDKPCDGEDKQLAECKLRECKFCIYKNYILNMTLFINLLQYAS